jgi:hypothetical protein
MEDLGIDDRVYSSLFETNSVCECRLDLFGQLQGPVMGLLT